MRSAADAAACAAIYAPYVLDTAVTFETEPPGPAEMAERIAAATRTHAWLVLEADDRIVGYAYGGPFKARARTAGHVRSASTWNAAGCARVVVGRCTPRC